MKKYVCIGSVLIIFSAIIFLCTFTTREYICSQDGENFTVVKKCRRIDEFLSINTGNQTLTVYDDDMEYLYEFRIEGSYYESPYDYTWCTLVRFEPIKYGTVLFDDSDDENIVIDIGEVTLLSQDEEFNKICLE